MTKRLKYFFRISIGLMLILFVQCRSPKQLDEYYCNLMAGEPSQTSVILVARLHKTDTLVNNDLKGIEGFIKFRITRDTHSKSYMESPFYKVSGKNDFTAKFEFTGLRPEQLYYYSISYGRDTSNTTSYPWSIFTTLNLPTSENNVCFVVTGGLEYESLSSDSRPYPGLLVNGNLFKSIIPVFNAISFYKPDFWILNDNFGSSGVSDKQNALTNQDFRAKWHRLFSNREFNRLNQSIPSFWILGENTPPENAIYDQLPINPGTAQPQALNRTYRLNRDIQIWILSSPCFSENSSSTQARFDKQFKWLKASLKESNSPFKLIISQSGIIGNYSFPGVVNPTASVNFETEKDSLFNWLKNNGFRNNGLYFICNGPEMQYHSVDPSGFEEFSSGPMIETGALDEKIGVDSTENNPQIGIAETYIQKPASGGFLLITSSRDEYSSPVLLFRFFDRERKLLYAVNKY
jgi:alkaline phosphatase/alkaline phosphatase D